MKNPIIVKSAWCQPWNLVGFFVLPKRVQSTNVMNHHIIVSCIIISWLDLIQASKRKWVHMDVGTQGLCIKVKTRCSIRSPKAFQQYANQSDLMNIEFRTFENMLCMLVLGLDGEMLRKRQKLMSLLYRFWDRDPSSLYSYVLTSFYI